MNLLTIHQTDFDRSPVIDLLPHNRVEKKVTTIRPLLRFFGIKRKTVKALIVEYYFFDDRLAVRFLCPFGYRLFLEHEKDKAERYLGKKIYTSPHVGEAVVTLNRQFVTHISCPRCGFRHYVNPSFVIVTGLAATLAGHIKIPIHDTHSTCLRCKNPNKVYIESTQQ